MTIARPHHRPGFDLDRPAAPSGPGSQRSTPLALPRLLVLAASAVAVQTFVVDEAGWRWLDGLDLPLALAALLVASRPRQSTLIGLVFGLSVDAVGHRLFGLHCLAYAVLGPVGRRLPVGPAPARPLRRWRPGLGGEWPRGREVLWLVAAQAAAARSVVVIGQTVAAGAPPHRWFVQLIETVVWTVVLVALVAPLLGRGSVGGRSLGRGRTVARSRLGSTDQGSTVEWPTRLQP